VGKNFASAITYKTKFVIFLELLDVCPKSFLLFKTEWKTKLRALKRWRIAAIGSWGVANWRAMAVAKFKSLIGSYDIDISIYILTTLAIH
jgi:hypothetical protein